MFKRKHISVPKPTQAELNSQQRINELLKSGATGVQGGAYQQNLLAPYIYGLNGMDVQYEDQSPRLQELQAQSDKATQALTAFRSAKGADAKKKAMDQLRASGAIPTHLRGQKLKKYLKGQINGAAGEIGTLSANPLRIKSISENAASKASRAKEDALYAQEQDLLKGSLSQNNEDVLNADPALKRQLQEEQAKLDQSQVQQFGSLAGAQGGTIGAVQNAAMGQRRAEAISNARRENIGLYAGLQTQQGGFNQQKRAQQAGLAAAPGAAQQQSGMNFGNLASGYGGLLAKQGQDKAMQFQANSFNQTQPGVADQIMGGIGSMLQPFKQNG